MYLRYIIFANRAKKIVKAKMWQFFALRRFSGASNVIWYKYHFVVAKYEKGAFV